MSSLSTRIDENGGTINITVGENIGTINITVGLISETSKLCGEVQVDFFVTNNTNSAGKTKNVQF